jgi:four helix bundle protein
MDYRKMIVWQKAMDLTVHLYSVIDMLPDTELYALSSQMRRAVVSIPSNIAEGAGRSTIKDKQHFFSIARGSACELQTQLLICDRLKYLDVEDIEKLYNETEEVNRILTALIDSSALR